MTTITNQTAPTSWTAWVRGKAAAIVNRLDGTRNAVANSPGLDRDMRLYAVEQERDMRVCAAELEHQHRKSRLLAGSYIGMID